MQSRSTRWESQPYDVAVAGRLAGELGVSRIVGAILARRGFADSEDARRFLAAEQRHDPLGLPGVPAACELILDHLRRGSRIAVFGDYDVDGVCSTAMLVRALRALGGDPAWELPSRFDEGYGLSDAAVKRLTARGTALLVTVDCGITAVEQVAAAKAAGLDVVVTDHHRPGPELPDCVVVHPALGAYGCPELCASGVVLKLSEALHGAAGGDPGAASEDLDLAALATVCDLVPLRDENRRIAREGVLALSRTRKPGLRALVAVAGVELGELTEHHLGFRLGPRINAAGRMRRADAALELLLTEDGGRAEEIARELDLLNRDRREAETRILSAAEAACEPQASQGAMVVAGEGWHPGVVGIVASRLVERWRRPCVVIALEDGAGRGSGRSISAYDLHAGLGACTQHLTRFGGHAMAAGVELEEGEVEPFRRALAAHAGAALAPGDLIPCERVDAVVPGGVLGLSSPTSSSACARSGWATRSPRCWCRRPASSTWPAWARTRSTPASRWSPPAERDRAGWPSARRQRRWRRRRPTTTTSPCASSATAGTGWWSRASSCEPCARHDRESCSSSARTAASGSAWRSRSSPNATRAIRPGARAAQPSRSTAAARDSRALRVTCSRVVRPCWSRWPTSSAGAPDSRRSWPDWRTAAWPSPPGARSKPTPRRWRASTSSWRSIPHPGVRPIRSCGRARTAHLAWSPAEAEFALLVWRAELDLRPLLADAYRALRELGPDADAERLQEALGGSGRYPRTPRCCARLLTVLSELALIEFSLDPPSCRLPESARTELERSAAYRAASERLTAIEGALARELPAVAPARAA